ncbi:MAG: MarR family transcriptional regulator [Clostridiales bacterium]|nr:MarR family transcriptional regulator [Clostridiales bacterium]
METMEYIILGRDIFAAASRLSVKKTADLKHYGLTPPQAEAILFFESHERARILDLKEAFKISHQSARTIVDRLHEKGYVCVEAAEYDGRAKIVHLTEEGEKICDEIKRLGHIAIEALTTNLSEEEKRDLLNILEKALTEF